MVLARTLALAIFLSLLAAPAVPAASTAASSPVPAAADSAAEATAKKKRGKARRTKCRRGYTYSRKRGRCVRTRTAPPPAQQPGGGGGGAPPPGGGNAPGSCATGCQVRDDSGFTAALAGSRMAGNEEGSQGFYTYRYDWCAGGTYSYASSYYSATVGNTVEDNRAGSWQVIEGYQFTHPDANGGQPLWTGAVDLTHSGGTTRVRVDISTQQGRAAVVGPSPFGGSNLTYTPGGAAC